jgi:hypothetical protein
MGSTDDVETPETPEEESGFSADDFAEARARKLREAIGEEEPTPGAADDEPVEAAPEAGPPTPAAVDDHSPSSVDDPESAAPEVEAEAEVDEQGRSEDEAVAEALDELPDDATQEERDAAEEQARSEFYVGRYKTREDAERGIAEQKLTIDRQFNEMKRMREALAAQPEPQQQQLDLPQWEEWAQREVENGAGERGAIAALENGGYQGYQIYLKAWLDDEDGRADAMLFNNAMMMEVADARAQAATAPIEQSADPGLVMVEARRMVEAKRPDLGEYESAMVEVVEQLDEGTRAWLTEQAQEGAEGQARVLDYLYLEARTRTAPKQAEAAAREAERRATSARRAKVGATVASAEATPARTPLNEAELAVIRTKNVRRKEWGLEPLPEE